LLGCAMVPVIVLLRAKVRSSRLFYVLRCVLWPDGCVLGDMSISFYDSCVGSPGILISR
jgi:hypothetical protein